MLTNVTVNGNRANGSAGGLYSVNTTMTVENSIIWGNTANRDVDIDNGTGAVTTVRHTLVKDAYSGTLWNDALGTDGGNNLGSDPRFATEINPLNAPTLAGDLHIQELSPAADAGDATRNASATDVEVADRLQGATIDMGAYESSHVAQLSIAKAVSPTVIEYGEPVTYTITLTNSGDAYAYSTTITDLLPANVAFVDWQQQPSGASYQSGSHEIAWTGTVTANQANTFQFVVLHTGGPDEVVTNTVTYDHATSSDSADIAFTVLPLPTVDIADTTIDEADGSAIFTVSLSTSSRKPVVLDYSTADASAVAPDDYTGTTNVLTITPGTTSGLITIPVNSDFVDEETETFTVTLTAAVDGTLNDATATSTIQDDDTAGTQVGPTVLSIDEPSGTGLYDNP
ncbi:MAG: Calx-beta domain-containing protein [Caldilineaceae bacterium]